MKENVVSLHHDDLGDTPERVHLKRVIAAQHAEDQFGTKDPSMWQWAKAYDYVEEQFGGERTDVLRSLAQMGRNPERKNVEEKTAPIGRKPHRHAAVPRNGQCEQRVPDALDVWIESRAAILPLPPSNDDSGYSQ
jgi:hypothetical protein